MRPAWTKWPLVVPMAAGFLLLALLIVVIALPMGAGDEGYSPEERSGRQLREDVVSRGPYETAWAFRELARRRDPIAQEDAKALLDAWDPPAAVEAALYLAAIGEESAVPALIRALGYSADSHGAAVLESLTRMTKQDFGPDRLAWVRWWVTTHPKSTYDVCFDPTALEASGSARGFVAADAITVKRSGESLRLAGIKPKSGITSKAALAVLARVIVRDQWYEIQYDAHAPDEGDGPQRVFLYWEPLPKEVANDPGVATWGPSRFKERTLIQMYLLKSGLYQYDPDSLQDPCRRLQFSVLAANAAAEPTPDRPAPRAPAAAARSLTRPVEGAVP